MDLIKKYFTVFMVFLLFTTLLVAQEQSGEITGRVLFLDETPAAGVKVKVKSNNLIGVRVVFSDENGKYRFPQLPPGIYVLIFSVEGFQTVVKKGILLKLGRRLRIDTVMQILGIQEEVSFEGEFPVMDLNKNSIDSSIVENTISRLPKRRNVIDLVTIKGGVDYEGGFSRGGYSFNGASASENTFFIDGMNTTATVTGISGQSVDYDFVEEIQIKSSGYNAEYGGSMGGVVSVITKKGGTHFHGDIKLYYTNMFFNGSPSKALKIREEGSQYEAYYMSPYKDRGYSLEPVFNLGGYFIKDRLWFFTSFIPKSEKIRRCGFFDNSMEHNGEIFESSIDTLKGFLRLSGVINSNLRGSVSFSMDIGKIDGNLPAIDGYSDYEGSVIASNIKTKISNIKLSGFLDYSISGKSFLTLAAGYYRNNNHNYGDFEPEAFMFFVNSNGHLNTASGLKRNIGEVNGSWYAKESVDRNLSQRFTFKGDLAHYFSAGGEHVGKIGFSYTNVKLDKLYGYTKDYWRFYWKDIGVYEYYENSRGEKIPLTYGYVRARYSGFKGNLNTGRYALFIQDSWTIGGKFTLNYGVRFEKEEMPSMDPEYTDSAFDFGFFDKVAPRFGFAYDIKGDGKSKLFGSFGIYYDVMKLTMAVGSFGGAKLVDNYYDISELDWTKYADARSRYWTESDTPVLGGRLLESIDLQGHSFDNVQPNIRPYSKIEISLGYQRVVYQDLSFTARFLHSKVLNGIEDIGIKIGSEELYFIGNPGSDWINDKYKEASETPDQDGNINIPAGIKCPTPKREFYSLQFTLDKKFSDNWLGGVSCTLSRLWGNFSGLASTDEDGRQDPNQQRYFDKWYIHYDSQLNEATGLLPTDRPLNIKVYGAYTFNFGLTLGINCTGKSGVPVSTSFDLNRQEGYYPNGRHDKGRTGFLYQIDLYAQYSCKLSEKLNLSFDINITNLTNNDAGLSKFQHITIEKPYLSNEAIVRTFTVDELIKQKGYIKDPRYLKYKMFMSPMEIRFGFKLIF